MEEQNRQTDRTETVDVGRTIIATAAKTAFFTVVLAALVCTLIVLLFPYGAMNFYIAIGNRHRALESAESYLKQYPETESRSWDSRYAGVLYQATSLAGDLFKDAQGDRKEVYAHKTIELTERYFTVDSVSMKNEEIDAFNVHKAVNPVLHPALYSVADYLTVTQYKANVYLGNYDALVWTRDRTTELDRVLNSTLATVNYTVTDTDARAWMILFNQMNAYIDGVFDEIGVGDDRKDDTLGALAMGLTGNRFPLFYTSSGENKGFTKLYTLLTDRFSIFSDYVNTLPRNSAEAALWQCYCVKAVSGFATRMDTVTYILSRQAYPIEVEPSEAMRWREKDVYRYGDGEQDYYYMTDFYQNTLLPAYVRLYLQEQQNQ